MFLPDLGYEKESNCNYHYNCENESYGMTLKHFIKIASLIALLHAGNASAVLLPVTCILTEDTNPEACAIGEAQLRIDVTDTGFNGIEILFTNIDSGLTIGGIDPNPGIHEIYFQTSRYTPTDSGFDEFYNSTMTVSPTSGAPKVRLFSDIRIPGPGTEGNMTPMVLPGGNEVGFEADFGIESTKDTPEQGDPFDFGINEGGETLLEWGKLRIDGFTFSAFEQAFLANDFRIGLHVRSFGEESASFVAMSAIPVPAAFWLFGTALIGFVGFSRRRSIGA